MTLQEFLDEKQYTTVSMRGTQFGHLEVAASINNISTLLLVDTGAASTVIDIAFAHEHGLPLTDTTITGGGVGTSDLVIHQLDNIHIDLGGFTLENTTIYAADLQHVKQSLSDKGETAIPSGVIGADILSRHHAIIDYQNLKLYLQPAT